MTTVQLLISVVVVVLLGVNPESVAAEKKETGHWGEWGAATPCSASCGAGFREIRRTWILAPGEVVEVGEPFTSSKIFRCNNNDVPQCPTIPRNFDMNQCTEKGNFTCTSKKMCIPIKGRCNQKVECHDGSDEMECPQNLATTVHGLDSILTCSAITMVIIVMAKMFTNE